jgi:hypothetical protein
MAACPMEYGRRDVVAAGNPGGEDSEGYDKGTGPKQHPSTSSPPTCCSHRSPAPETQREKLRRTEPCRHYSRASSRCRAAR